MNQLEALKGALKHLRNENAMLKGNALLKQMEALPALARRSPLRTSQDSTEAVGGKSGDESDTRKVGEPVKRAALRPARANIGAAGSVRAEARSLYASALTTLALSSVVDLTPVVKSGSSAKVVDGKDAAKEGENQSQRKGLGRPWLPYHKQPEIQLQHQTQARAKLLRQLSAFSEKLGAAQTTSAALALRTVKA